MIIKGDTIVEFLVGEGEDYKGRTFASMLNWSDEQLEQCHDQVQWMFPLHEESKHASTYPVVDKALIDKIKSNRTIHIDIAHNLLKAKDRFESFYGIGDYEDVDKQRKWCRNHNHNLLRVTRIIRCLRLFGLTDAAKDFHNKVTAVGKYFGISDVTLQYWDRALNDNVWDSLQ